MPTAPTLRDWTGLMALGLIWGASFLGIAVALEGATPFWIATIRIGIGGFVLGLIAMVMRLRLPRDRRVWVFAVAMGVFSNAAPFTLLGFAQQHVTSGFAGITMAAIPLFTIGFAHFLVPGEQLTRNKVAGFLLGLLGVAVLIGPGVLGASGSELEAWARLACLAACISYATGAILTRRCPPVHAVSFGIIALGSAALMLLPLALILEGAPVWPGTRPALALLYLGLLPTGLATLLIVMIIRSAGPSFLTQVNYQVPLWSVLLGVFVLAEDLPGSFLLALGIIMAGLALTRRRARPVSMGAASG
jgi:drug/metabolite transporter (DMT)-like permease